MGNLAASFINAEVNCQVIKNKTYSQGKRYGTQETAITISVQPSTYWVARPSSKNDNGS